MTYAESISNEEISALPGGAFNGRIVVVDDLPTMEQAAQALSRCGVIGFDTETRPAFQKGKVNQMALVQLSSDDTAFLFRINKLPLSSEMLAILGDERIVKVGASIRDDIKGIQKQTPFTPGGFVDIQSIVGQYGIRDLSVRKVSAIVLGVRISKAQRLSNWEAQVLTPAQQLYAATDAWACREIYLKLTEIHR
ncbi:MAG: 3'-5' exonuclease domain-containing protein 2 [Rikenellaceae bacterium]|jgi:ribonuclease D|nr:3'-5' exonuclease domain-containing protein 2 [Rikenellaceae bacterium]